MRQKTLVIRTALTTNNLNGAVRNENRHFLCRTWKVRNSFGTAEFFSHVNSFLMFLFSLTYLYFTRRSLGSPGAAFGHSRETVASRSPDSWQHMHERSVCHSFDPETYKTERERTNNMALSSHKIFFFFFRK